MTLQGSLDTFSVPDVLALLAQTGKTGALHVRGDRSAGVLYFQGGRVCGAEAGDHTGPVDADMFDERLVDVCFELLRYDGGSFEFEPEAGPLWPTDGEAEVSTLMDEAADRLEEWRTIEAVIPSMELRPRLADQLPADSITIDRPRWRVLTAVDGRRRVSVIARVLDMSEFHLCRVMKLLVDDGIVELDTDGRPGAGDLSVDEPESVEIASYAPPVSEVPGPDTLSPVPAAPAVASEEWFPGGYDVTDPVTDDAPTSFAGASFPGELDELVEASAEGTTDEVDDIVPAAPGVYAQADEPAHAGAGAPSGQDGPQASALLRLLSSGEG